MKILFTLLLSFSLLYSYVGNKIISLQLNWKNQFQFAGYIMAKELGYYNDVKLDVRLIEFSRGRDAIELLKSGDIEFAIGRPSLMIDKSKGEDLVALGAIFQHSPMVLLTRDSVDINDITDLKNRKVMITNDAKISASLIAMFISNNIQLKDIKIQEHSFNIQDLIDKKTDAMASYISNEPIVLKNRGINYKIFNPRDYGFDFYEDILFTSSLYLENNPQIVKDFYEATIKGWKYAFDNIRKSATVIYEKYNTQKKSLKSLIEEGYSLKEYAIDNDINKIGHLDKRRLEKICDVYKIIGLLDSEVDIDSFVYKNNNYDVIELELSNNQIYLYIFYFLIIFGLLTLLIIYYIIRKRWLIPTATLDDVIETKTNQLKEESITDSLTEVKNRKAYNEKIKELLNTKKRHSTPFCLVSIDIDDFKKINDEFGHDIGDEVLIKFCRLVEMHLRANDTIFRVGGEEFMILLPNTDIENGHKVCKKLLLCTQESLLVEEKKNVTVSVGLVEVKEDDTEESIYKRVDILLYKSKRNGKNQISF
ncbi:GGDEF domain-containing protein [Halarcobacter ebronensis]|uniref:Thiamine pyrimidine synthase n=1 Tax=Halarcobacter ebronensis TaxID=1462615 RepID=A0A4Q1APQ2_9BACT|nr:GGDEF domain-containing protein [Halarcobacter ebronensis]QKF80848.1 diguanylate cyclase [Halarcobacter ebronensis]RXK08638.1 diguanylate cyclase [Halarcobacter ebronensis]